MKAQGGKAGAINLPKREQNMFDQLLVLSFPLIIETA